MRFPRYQSLFHGLLVQLNELQLDTSQLGALHELQRRLIRAILGAERRVLRLKEARHRLSRLKARERLSKERAAGVKALMVAIDSRVSDLRQVMFLLRCIGDGIAFTYQSKYSLKHLMFDESYRAKQMPGFITGKKGFLREYRVLCRGFKAGVPVLLSDLTNIIRHGDVCAMGGPDPVPIEVKTSASQRARPQRQRSQLRVLAEFYKNDGAKNFRGALNVKRTELHAQETTWVGVMNDCVRAAVLNKVAMREPEAGLRYIAVRPELFEGGATGACEEFVLSFVPERCLVVQPTPEPTWFYMQPFTLTLDPDNALAYMQGQVLIFIVVNLQLAKEMFQELGVHAVAMFDGQWSFQISRNPDDFSQGVFRVSEDHFLRVTHEFLSLRWFVEENAAFMSSEDFQQSELSVPPTQGDLEGCVPWNSPQLDEWRNVRDFWDTSGPAGST